MNAFTRIRKSRTLVQIVVTVALFLDAMSITTIIPIVPNFLAELDATVEDNSDELISGSSNSTISDNTLKINILFSSKALIQLIVAPFIGILTNRLGYTIPMFSGFLVMFTSTLMFAFSRSYTMLLIARSLQGMGSAFSSIAGLAMLSTWFPDDKERGQAMATAFSGTGVGVTLGPLFGGIFYSYFGITGPFLILASLALIDGCLRLCIIDIQSSKDVIKNDSLFTLFKDPYITLAAGALLMSNVGIAVLEANLPARMAAIMQADSVVQAVAFLPISVMFFLGSNIFGRLSYRLGRCQTTMVALFLMGAVIFMIPYAQTLLQLLLPLTIFGLTLGTISSSILPYLAYIVDIRHTPTYGVVYSIAEEAFCLGFFLGPVSEGTIVQFFGFDIAMYILGALCILYAPVLFFLRNPSTKQEEEPLLVR